MAQLATASPPPRKRSDPARPEFAWEPLASFLPEALPLLRRHWRELETFPDKAPFDPDWSVLLEADRDGRFFAYTARSDGRLVGYIGFVLWHRQHSKNVRTARADAFWLDPAYRFGWTGIHLIKRAEQELCERGADQIYVGERLHFEAARGGVGKILKRLGYVADEVLYTKFVGG